MRLVPPPTDDAGDDAKSYVTRTYTPHDIPAAAQVLDTVRRLGLKENRRWPRNRVERIILATLAATGLRAQELAGLNVGHVHASIDLPYIFVPGSVVKRGAGQEGRSRTVPLTWAPPLLPVIREWLEERAAMGATAHDPFICSLDKGRAGKRLTRKQVRTYAIAAMRWGRWWRDGFTTHTLRHFFATYAIADPRIGVVKVRNALGHSDLTITTRYAHETPDGAKWADIFGGAAAAAAATATAGGERSTPGGRDGPQTSR